jgi:hypothetical protein
MKLAKGLRNDALLAALKDARGARRAISGFRAHVGLGT